MLRVLAVGDVCGSAGVEYLKKNLRLTAEANEVDLIVVNGENAADIHGISVADVSRLFKAGADVITTGNHAFRRRECYPLFTRTSRAFCGPTISRRRRRAAARSSSARAASGCFA